MQLCISLKIMTTFIHTAISLFLQLEINYVKFPRNDRLP